MSWNLFIDKNEELGDTISENSIKLDKPNKWAYNGSLLSHLKENIEYNEQQGEPYTIISIGDGCKGIALLDWLQFTNRKEYLIHLHGQDDAEKRLARHYMNLWDLKEYVDEELDKRIQNYYWYTP